MRPGASPIEHHVGGRAPLAGHDVGRFLADRETAAAVGPYLLVQGVQRRQGDRHARRHATDHRRAARRPGVPGDLPGTARIAARGDRVRQGHHALRRARARRLGLPRRRAHGPGLGARRPARAGRGAFGLKYEGGELYVAGGPTGFGLRLRRAHGRGPRRVRLRRRVRQRRDRHPPGRVLHRLQQAVHLRVAARAARGRPVRAPDHAATSSTGAGLNANGIAATPDGAHADPRVDRHGQALHGRPADRRDAADRRPARGQRRRHPAARPDALRGAATATTRSRCCELDRRLTRATLRRGAHRPGLRRPDDDRRARPAALRGQRALQLAADAGDDLRRRARSARARASPAAPPTGSARAGWTAGACAGPRTRAPRPSWRRCRGAPRSPCRGSRARCGAGPRARAR